jgi:hypothetical protein
MACCIAIKIPMVNISVYRSFTIPFPVIQNFLWATIFFYTLVIYLVLLKGDRSRKPRLTTVGIRCADHGTPSIRKSWH